MKLSETFKEGCIVPDMAATQKAEALRELVDALCASGAMEASEAKTLTKALLRREELGTTGIGKGLAMPHAKHTGVKGVVGALGVSRRGVAFESMDGQPVHIIFLLVSGPDAVNQHLEMMKKLTRVLRDDDLCRFFKQAKQKKELADLLVEAEERLAQAQ